MTETGFSNQKGPKVNKPRKKKTQIIDIDSNEDY